MPHHRPRHPWSSAATSHGHRPGSGSSARTGSRPPPAAATRLFTALQLGPPGDIRDTQPSATFVLRFGCPDGPTHSIELRFTADAAHFWIRDGQRSAVVPAELIAQAAGAVL